MRRFLHNVLTFVSFFEERLGNRFAPPVSRYLTANQVTALSAISIPGALMMAEGGYAMMLIGAIIFYFGRWLDYLDGPVARHTGKVSQFGQDLDTVITGVSQSVLFIGLGLLWGGDYAVLGWVGGILSIVIRIVHRTRNYLLPDGHPTLKQQAHRYLWMRAFFDSFGCLPFWWIIVFAAIDMVEIWFVGSVILHIVGCIFFAYELVRLGSKVLFARRRSS